MRRSRVSTWVVGGFAIAIAVAVASAMVVVVAVAAPAWLPARVGIIAVRSVVIATSKIPTAATTLLGSLVGSGAEGGAALPVPGRQQRDAPILVVTTTINPFTGYLVEILRAEGLNALATCDVGDLTADELAAHDIVVLGETSLTPAQVALLTAWTDAGGTLIAMRPARALGPLLGLTPADATLSDGYLRVDPTAPAGRGIVHETMQFHGTADGWTIPSLGSADGDPAVLATLHADARTPSPLPAVVERRVGARGGRAAAFTYDLARSVVYTRQGNPAWAGQSRLGSAPRRTVDLFFGAARFDPAPSWVDFDTLAIPHADEQQRLLANLIVLGAAHRKPVPRFWYLPNGVPAAIVMTGDGHDDAGLAPRFERYLAASPDRCSVADWECVRATAYTYVGTTFTRAEAARYTGLGFDVGLHVNTNCTDWAPPTFDFLVGLQLRHFRATFPDLPAPSSSRTHCAAWSDWSSAAAIEAAHGIRFDTNYYFYPAGWTRGRAGLFTGSGFPLRFAAADGRLIDCYQAATQITDESGLVVPEVVDQLLDRATGPEGYYGVFTANMHYDLPVHPDSDAIVASAQAHGVPVVSARQMLEWLDGRNASSFDAVAWSDRTLRFTIAVGTGARNLRALVPAVPELGTPLAIERDGAVVAHEVRTIKGIDYALFPAEAGRYAVRYRREPTRPGNARGR